MPLPATKACHVTGVPPPPYASLRWRVVSAAEGHGALRSMTICASLFGAVRQFTQLEKIADFLPVDTATVEPQPQPAARPDVRRQVEALGVGASTVDVLAEGGLAAHRDDAVTVVIVEE